MIGLGVGIDYALFILTRYPRGLRHPGPDLPGCARVGRPGDGHGRTGGAVRRLDGRDRAARHDAARRQLPLWRRALGLDRRPVGDARLAHAAACAVDVRRRTRRGAAGRARKAVAATAASGEPGTPSGAAHAAHAGDAWVRWSGFVQGRPWTIAAIAALSMLLIAAPATALRLGSSDASNDPAGQTTHRAYELPGGRLRPGLQRPAARGRQGADPSS